MKIPIFDQLKRNTLLEEYKQILEHTAQAHKELKLLYADDASKQVKKIKRGEIKNLIKSEKPVLEQYGHLIPRIKVSECPYTNEPLIIAFDPIALDGFWWTKKLHIPYKGESYPESFRVLRGAVNLNNRSPFVGSYEILIGPGVPYVIPRILEIPTMQLVISQITLEIGYTAYLLAYFSSQEPGPGQLTSPWLHEDEYYFHDIDGHKRWKVANDAWDFDIASWVKKGKIKWIEAASDTLAPASSDPENCPYVGIIGEKFPRVIKNQQVFTRRLPDPSIDVELFD